MSSYLHDLDLDRIPAHVAIVMDGNGRWARAARPAADRGPRRRGGGPLGHGQGRRRRSALPWLTVFAFSTENWRRPPGEVRYLMNFNRSLLRRRRDELHRMNVRIRFIGRRNWRVPRSVLKEIRAAEELTAANTGTTLSIAFNYGGRAEIVDAVKELAREVRDGTLRPESIDENDDRRAPVRRRHAAPGPADPHERRATDLELPPVGGRLLRALVHAGLLAGLRPRASSSRRSATSRSARGASAASPTSPEATRLASVRSGLGSARRPSPRLVVRPFRGRRLGRGIVPRRARSCFRWRSAAPARRGG